MELVLIRHPAVALAPGVCYGAADVALAGDVAGAAQRLRALLPAGADVLASPARRCRLLAEALGGAPVYDARLGEMDFGDWELQSWERVGRAALDAWAADPFGFRPPGGETAAEMAARVLTCFEEWRTRAPQALVVVAHGGPLRAIAGTLLGLPQSRWLALAFRCGCAARFELAPHSVCMTGFNL